MGRVAGRRPAGPTGGRFQSLNHFQWLTYGYQNSTQPANRSATVALTNGWPGLCSSWPGSPAATPKDSGDCCVIESEPSATHGTEPSRDPHDFPIVGIGASAGGLESLERLFSHLPTDTGMAFVVLQHLSPAFKSLMYELLARRTSMPVREAEHAVLLEPNAVYPLPPIKEMIIRDRRLLLSDRDPRHGLALPIDHFFRSLARDAGERAIAVILSGSGSDGSRGVQEVRRLGGVVF